MNGIYENILETIGNTPLVRINALTQGLEAGILAKMESFNPMSSVKDRIGRAMIEAAEAQGRLQPGGVIIEPTSGNTGIALALAAAVKGYRLILTMPETMSEERRLIMKILGAELVLTEGSKGMRGAIDRAARLQEEIPNSVILQQFKNPANPEVHRRSTAQEIWRDSHGNVDIFIAGVGTGGTLTGVGSVLKELNPDVRIIALEPKGSAVLSGEEPGPHKLQGIGAGFVPDVLDRGVIDEILQVREQDAAVTARRLARQEGILTGISGGAAMWAALEVARRPSSRGRTIVVLLPDSGERYLSTWLFFDGR